MDKKINIELVKAGYANGAADGRPLTEDEKLSMICDAEEAFGKFLDALKVNWREDPNSINFNVFSSSSNYYGSCTRCIYSRK